MSLPSAKVVASVVVVVVFYYANECLSDLRVMLQYRIDETAPKKRVHLSINLSSSSSDYSTTVPLFNMFLRLTDRLVASAHFRPEVMRKIRNAREEEVKHLRRADEEEKAEERKLAAEKQKKEERERLLRGMNADEQRKFLERERKGDLKRGQKKATRKA